MKYEEVVRYIEDIPKFTKKHTLLHTREFMRRLGNPCQGRKVLHVAGTNGKGSVCAYMQAILLFEGKRVGFFTSPHLVKLNERIRINGKDIDDDTFCRIFAKVRQVAEELEKEGMEHPSYFEFLYGMGMLAFEENDAEYIVLETGLGGRLDATNSFEHPFLSVITSIGLDHTEILGNTLEEIAAEKAGILKPHVPVIFADTQQESSRVIEERAGELGCPCKKIGKSAYEILKIQDGTLAFSPSNAYYGDTTWKMQNTAMYQPENAMLAMEAMRMIFGEQGDVSGWREALSQVKWEGRMEEILPDFYVDGAHNVSAVRMFVQSIQRDRREKVVLFSAVREKNYEEMIRILCQEKSVSEYVITLIEDKRAAQTEELKQIFQKYTDKPVVVKEELHQALTYLFSRKAGKAVYCLGSLYLTGMIKALIPDRGENAVRKQGDKNT